MAAESAPRHLESIAMSDRSSSAVAERYAQMYAQMILADRRVSWRNLTVTSLVETAVMSLSDADELAAAVRAVIAANNVENRRAVQDLADAAAVHPDRAEDGR